MGNELPILPIILRAVRGGVNPTLRGFCALRLVGFSAFGDFLFEEVFQFFCVFV